MHQTSVGKLLSDIILIFLWDAMDMVISSSSLDRNRFRPVRLNVFAIVLATGLGGRCVISKDNR
jgi:hypothetical protein